MRALSYSEITTALDCFAKHDFRYGGYLAGDALSKRSLSPHLSDGRAWGAAVAAWHSQHASSGPVAAALEAGEAAGRSYREDFEAMREKGAQPLPEWFVDQRFTLDEILAHYFTTAEPFPNLTRLEGEITVPIWSRSGKGRSNRFVFVCYIDGWTTQYANHSWVVEFKLRSNLHDAEQIERSRQPRWYAWALRELWRQQGHADTIAGVITDERLKVAPKDARLVQGKRKDQDMVPSHAKDQVTTVDSYRELCAEYGEDPKPVVIEALSQRRWQQRISLPYRPSELDEAGRELISAANLIRQLDAGQLYPIRNASPRQCSSCDFKSICSSPQDKFLVDMQFVRKPPKRLRGIEEEAA